MSNKIRENKRFMAFCIKVHERLTIMFDDNLHKHIDPIEEDILLLTELYKIYDAGNLPWLKEGDDIEQIVTQSQLFTDKKTEDH